MDSWDIKCLENERDYFIDRSVELYEALNTLISVVVKCEDRRVLMQAANAAASVLDNGKVP